jgi:hypothetical protein
VLVAGLTLAALAGGLGLRVVARSEPAGTTAALERNVPAPRPIVPRELPTPTCWSCDWNEYRPLEFEVDLDHLAPLGTGGANAALWLAEFARPSGKRADETERRRVEVDIDGQTWSVFRSDDPLLLEAEPWVDQARCRFYEEVWQVAGVETPVPNVLLALNLARSWVARGKLADDPRVALADYRRAIRLGRMLRQDDVTLFQDLVAIACIRMGAEAIYELAREQGDAVTMATAAIVLADHGAMRNRAAQRVTALKHVFAAVRRDANGAPVLEAPDGVVDAALELARRVPERRFVLEALFAVQVIRQLGSSEQRTRAEALLDEIASREDAIVARRAREVRAESVDTTQLDAMIEALAH